MGGSVCSGKSTVVKHLAAQWSVPTYGFDERERDHLERLGRSERILERIENPEAKRAAFDDRWLSRPPADMALRTMRSWKERFALVLEDLAGMNEERMIVEGAGLFPELVGPLLNNAGRGVCLIATPEFIRWARHRRGMTAPELTSDPEFARENIIARDCLMAAHVREEAQTHGLSTITVDGSESVEAIAEQVASCFGWSQSV